MKKFFKGFTYALNGWGIGLRERNMRFHLVAALCVVIASLYFQLSQIEWVMIFFAIGIVLSAELVNTAIECLAKTLRDKGAVSYSDIGPALDLSAGAVLISTVTASVIGCSIFLPKLFGVFFFNR